MTIQVMGAMDDPRTGDWRVSYELDGKTLYHTVGRRDASNSMQAIEVAQQRLDRIHRPASH